MFFLGIIVGILIVWTISASRERYYDNKLEDMNNSYGLNDKEEK